MLIATLNTDSVSCVEPKSAPSVSFANIAYRNEWVSVGQMLNLGQARLASSANMLASGTVV